MAINSFGDNTAPHLDLPAALHKIGEASAVRDMLGMLADLLAQDVPKIRQALFNQDLAVAGCLVHSLKGCMPIFCTPPICNQIALVELHAKLGDSGQAQQAYASLGPALAALQLEIELHLATPAETLE